MRRWQALGAAWQAWLFGRVVAAPPVQGRQVLWVCVAAASGLLGGLAWQWPAIREERAAWQAKLAKAQAQRDAWRQPVVASPAPLPQESEGAQPAVDPWPWHRAALAAGLVVERAQAVLKDGGAAPSTQLHLRLRGRFHQHGAWVARMASEPTAPRLLSHQLLAGDAGLHLAEVVLAPWPLGPGPGLFPAPARAYRPAAHLDPLAEPVTGSTAAAGQALGAPQRPWHETVPLADWTLAGTLHRQGEWVALLGHQGRVHTVRAGDTLGGPYSHVLRVEEQGLWLQERVREGGVPAQPRERLWRVGVAP